MKIALITGSRAEWGLLKPLAEKIQADSYIDLNLIVTGCHLSPQFGMTVKEIEKDNYTLDRIECILASDTPVAISKAIGLAIISFGEAYERLKPDLVIVLGDRFEILASAITAHISNIPLCHIHGGEITEGSYDDAFRHSITKMSQLHFVAAEPYRDRVIQLGEHPDTVFCVGALGCDEMEKRQKPEKYNRIMIVYHPETLHGFPEDNIVEALLNRQEEKFIINCNADNGSYCITSAYYLYKGSTDWRKEGLSHDEYIGELMHCDCIIGNSSSGIIEAPALGVPTINIGDRQKGRLMADSIIQAEPTKGSIEAAFDILYSERFQNLMKTDYYMPYQGKNVAEKILAIIRERGPNINMKKGFYDL